MRRYQAAGMGGMYYRAFAQRVERSLRKERKAARSTTVRIFHRVHWSGLASSARGPVIVLCSGEGYQPSTILPNEISDFGWSS